MTSSWWFIWLVVMFLFLATPIGYGWGYRGWGAPYPRYSFSRTSAFGMIVMGTHGRTGLRRALMGSVAEAVVRRAHCPVLTIHLPTGIPEAGALFEEVS